MKTDQAKNRKDDSMFKKISALFYILLLASVVLAGCGQSNGTQNSVANKIKITDMAQREVEVPAQCHTIIKN